MQLMVATRRDIQEAFHRKVLDAWQRHQFKSYRQAEQATGVNYSTIYALVSRGRIPTRGQVIEWAEGLGEPIDEWLESAGYDALRQPDPLDTIGAVLRKSAPEIPEQGQQQVRDLVRELMERYHVTDGEENKEEEDKPPA